MKADVMGIGLKVEFKNIYCDGNREENKFSPLVVHDEYRI